MATYPGRYILKLAEATSCGRVVAENELPISGVTSFVFKPTWIATRGEQHDFVPPRAVFHYDAQGVSGG